MHYLEPSSTANVGGASLFSLRESSSYLKRETRIYLISFSLMLGFCFVCLFVFLEAGHIDLVPQNCISHET